MSDKYLLLREKTDGSADRLVFDDEGALCRLVEAMVLAGTPVRCFRLEPIDISARLEFGRTERPISHFPDAASTEGSIPPVPVSSARSSGDVHSAATMEKFRVSFIPEPNTGCWIWIGSIGTDGYGKLSRNGITIAAHRLAWELRHGRIPAGMCVMHSCDNPPCVNPRHLSIGSISDNNNDTVRKGRHACAAKKFCPRGHPYSEANTRIVVTAGRHSRICRACSLLLERARRAGPLVPHG